MSDAVRQPTLLTFVKPEGEYDEWGPYFYLGEELGPYLFEPKAEDLAPGRCLFPIKWLVAPGTGRGFDGTGLEGIGIPASEAELVRSAVYEDEYNDGRDMRAFVASAILTEDGSRWAELAMTAKGNPYLRGGGVDPADWARDLGRDLDADTTPNDIERGVMGTGYTNGTLPSDGNPDFERAAIKLSDGSLLLGWATTWYNK